MPRRLLGQPAVAWRRTMALTMPRERALRRRLELEFARAAGIAAGNVLRGTDPESGLLSHEQRVMELLRAAYSEGMPRFGGMVIDAAGKAAKKPPKFEALVRAYIEEVGLQKVKAISRTTREQLRSIVARARAEGLSTQAIAKRIRQHSGGVLGKARAFTIARTETHSAANAAQFFAAESLGRENMQREWIAANDERTRDDHAAADGQVVALEQPFEVGGELLMYPGDAGGPPEQIINCRCTTGFIMPD